MPALRILAYSPKPETLAPAIAALASQGYEVAGTTNETEALSRLRSGGCDVLLISVPPSSPDGPPLTATLVRTASRLAVAIPGGTGLPLPLEASLENLPQVLRELRSRLGTGQRETAPQVGPADFLEGAQSPEDLPARVVEALARATGMRVWAFWQPPGGQEESLSTDKGVPPSPVREMARWARERGLLTVGQQGTAGWVAPKGADPTQPGLALPLRLAGEPLGAVVLMPAGKGPLPGITAQAAAPYVALLAALIEQRRLRAEAEASARQAAQVRDAMERREQEVRALNKLMQMHQGDPAAALEKEEVHRLRALDALKVMAGLLENGEPASGGMAEKTAQWGALIAKSLGASPEVITQTAYLRDVGMPRMPAGVADPLRRQMELRHPMVAEQTAKALGLPLEVQLAARHHHESYNGSGYPDGLKEATIPMASRVLRVVEDYLALTAGSVAAGDALLRLRQQAGKLYDPAVLDALEKVALAQPGRGAAPEMISTVTHELRSPLTFLVGYSELLATQEDLPKEAQARAKEIHQEALHMSGLVDDLLRTSRYEAGRMEFHIKDVSISDVVARAVAKAKLKAKKHNILTDLPRGLPTVKADPDKLQQVLDNLLDNAIKYSPNGGLIGVRAEEKQGRVVVSVSDSGVGLSPEQQGRLFQKFYRAESSIKEQTPGTGLGLYLCKHILEGQGGSIWVESEEGKGSTFSFSLPF